MTKCLLHSEWKSCCCNCVRLLTDRSDFGKGSGQRYICIVLADEGSAYSKQSKHGLCEMHKERKR